MIAKIFYNKREKKIAVVPEMGNGVIISRHEIMLTGVTPLNFTVKFADWKQIEEREF